MVAQNTKTTVFEEAGFGTLEVINDIKFTQREIDIIACILSGRAAKTIASLLSISPKTVEAHTRNIMLKLACNSRESIINFIEKSGQFLPLRKHYQTLLIRSHFEYQLHKISALILKKDCTCRIIDKRGHENDPSFISEIKTHLERAGFRPFPTAKDSLDSHDSNHTLYVISDPSEEQFQSQGSSHFLLWDETLPNYYLLFLNVLKNIFPDISFDKILADFQKEYELIYGDCEQTIAMPSPAEDATHIKSTPSNLWGTSIFKSKKKQLITAILFLLSALSIFFLMTNSTIQSMVFQNIRPIRSNLLIPNETALLNRAPLIMQLKEKLKGKEEIQVAALVGMGGIGKTTIARHFAQSQESAIVWEINAETKDSLISSFKELAYALVKTKKQKEKLDFIQKIQSLDEKEMQILSFVKESLSENGNWLLIYDNVETFSDIKNYFPQDRKSWGIGKVIITTRDNNIRNTSYIKPESVIYVEELSLNEALDLFSKIFYGCEPKDLTKRKKEKTTNFLRHIPPFPLDVSVAAYYIKNAQITYAQYLERIAHYSQHFETTQETLLKEMSDYTKTRYGIITSSLEKFININPEFKGLLLLICFLDSQNIPKKLLELYSNHSIVDSFIYNLRKYSLITSTSSNTTLSLHRSTQTLGQFFLLSLLTQADTTAWVDKGITTFNHFYETHFDNKREDIIRVIPHLKVLLKNLRDMNLSQGLKEKYARELNLIMGYAHKDCTRNIQLAKKYLSRAYRLRDKSHPLPDKVLAKLLRSLGESHLFSGAFDAYDQSLFYCQESLKICEKIPNSENLMVENLEIMGVAYQDKNKFEEAKSCLTLALTKISSLKKEEKDIITARIYTILAYIYSITYLNKQETVKAEDYALESLKLLNASKLLSKTAPGEQPEKIPFNSVRPRMLLGQVYTFLGRYDEAMTQVEEVEYINTHPAYQHHADPLLMGRILFDKAEIFLRTGRLEEAERTLAECIRITGNLLGNAHTLKSRIHGAEIKIRLGKLTAAYEDCSFVFRTGQRVRNNNYNLLHAICFYHAAIIKYKQNELTKSQEHFVDFFREIQVFCQSFLTKKDYTELVSKGVFDAAISNEADATTLTRCLQQSVAIFSMIYGPFHPFVRDYVLKNTVKETES